MDAQDTRIKIEIWRAETRVEPVLDRFCQKLESDVNINASIGVMAARGTPTPYANAANEEGEKEDAAAAAAAVVEEYRELVVEGAFQHAMETCRRLMRTESNAQRVETAHLVLDRLRSNKDDSEDDVDALLRLVSNYVSPTRDLTEDALSLLFFCDQRVLLIHHLSKLTYQSKECVELVVESYLELLSSDRSLLVPILGSLADLPLNTAEKSAVLDATECLLDAAVEEDVPAVVQSLLSMVTVSTAPRIAAKLRAECNRVDSGTLCLTFEVIGRFAVAGSAVLNAFLHVIRYTEALTPFDIIFLTYLMGKSTENEIAIKTSTFIAHRGRFHHSVMREALGRLVQQEWRSVLPSCLRLCSFLLAVCFQDLTSKKLALEFITIAVDCLGFLVESRSSVHEEALTLLFTLSSQPKKLLMLATSSTAQRSRGFLCWRIAEAVALRLAKLGTHKNKVLAPYAHLFLDHLHAIASATNDSNGGSAAGNAGIGNYPSNTIDLLCCTMVTLTQQERGVFSLLMITIQKQLVARVGMSGIGRGHQGLNLRNRNSSSRSAAAAHVKQLMALFLAGHLLKSTIALEERDRKSLVNWVLRLLSTAASDETLLHALRLVREGMTGSSSPFMKNLASEEEQALCSSLIAQIFRKKGLIWNGRDEILARRGESSDSVLAYDVPASSGDAAKSLVTPSSLVVDLKEFTRKMQFGVNTFGRTSVKSDAVPESAIEREYLTKLNLLRELYGSFIAFSPPKHQERILDGGFVFPSLYRTIVASEMDKSSLEAGALGELIWSIVCALDIAVASVNATAKQLVVVANDKREVASYHNRLSSRLKICLELHSQLQKLIVVQTGLLEVWKEQTQEAGSGNGNAKECEQNDIDWLRVQASIAERLMNGQIGRGEGSELASASLYGIDSQALCTFFEMLWKKATDTSLPLAHELELLRVLSYHLHFDGAHTSTLASMATTIDTGAGGALKSDAAHDSLENKHMLLHSSEGRRTVKYIAGRAAELGRLVNASEYKESDGDQADTFSDDASGSMMKELATWNLLCIYGLFIQILEYCSETNSLDGSTSWNEKTIKLFATGCSPESTSSTRNSLQASRDIIYHFLLQECLKTKDPRLACALVDILMVLTLKTRKQRAMSHLCTVLLRQPFPTSALAAVLGLRDLDLFNVPGEALPVLSLPHAVVSLRGGSQCSLATYRCYSLKWRHLVYFTVGSWAFCSNASAGCAMLGSYLDAMKALVESVVPKDNDGKKASSTGESEADESDDGMRELPAVLHGEHRVLTSLTIETFPLFFDSVILCSVASLFRASPKRSEGASAREINPFEDVCSSLAVIHNAMTLYVDAESGGFNLPAKTNLLVLRGASYILKSVKLALQKCISWRAEQKADDERGALHHLENLFLKIRLVLHAMDGVLGSFQERVLLKMHQNAGVVSTSNKTPTRNLGAGRWKNELLAKTYGKRYRKRRWISKNESKLLPYFAHGIEELKDFVDHQSVVNSIEEEPDVDRSGWILLDSSGNHDSDRFLKSGSIIDLELTSSSLSDWNSEVDANWEVGVEEEDAGAIDEVEMEDENDPNSEKDEDGRFEQCTVLTPRKVKPRDRKSVEVRQVNEELGFAPIVVNYKKQKKSRNA